MCCNGYGYEALLLCLSLAALATSCAMPCKDGGYCRVIPGSLLRKRRLREVIELAPNLRREKAELGFELGFAWLPPVLIHHLLSQTEYCAARLS